MFRIAHSTINVKKLDKKRYNRIKGMIPMNSETSFNSQDSMGYMQEDCQTDTDLA